MSDLIATIKAELGPLPKFVASETSQRVVHKKNGHYLTDCPFCHSGKTLWINENVCNCFRKKCAAENHMDLINFFARLHEVDNRIAIEQLAKRLPGYTQHVDRSPIILEPLATMDLWDLPGWLEQTGREVAGLIEWVADPKNPQLLRAFLPVREVAKNA